MTAPPPPPPYYGPPPRPLAWQSPGIIVAVVLAVFFVLGFFIFLVNGLAMSNFSTFVLAPFCFFIFFVFIVIVVAVSRGMTQTRIPPPPPIQGPMVPAGQMGPVALNCPNCGAPPQNVDRFGVATCTYCNTRFLVR